MKESSQSLRWFFGVIGTFYLISFFLFFLSGPKYFVALTAFSSPIGILNIVWLFGHIYFAFMLQKYLNPKKVIYVNIFLFVPLAQIVLGAMWDLVVMGTTNFIILAGGVMLTWYLYINVHRLALPPPSSA